MRATNPSQNPMLALLDIKRLPSAALLKIAMHAGSQLLQQNQLATFNLQLATFGVRKGAS